MAWAEDDMEIVQQMAAERGVALPQAGLNREICRALKPKRFKLDDRIRRSGERNGTP
jgi:hypothetical protein